MTQRFYTAQEFAELTGTPRESVYYLVSQHRIPHIRIGNRIKIPATHLDRLEEEAYAKVSTYHKSARRR